MTLETSINFIIGLIFNQSYSSRLAWEAPHKLKARLNTSKLSLKEIEALGEERIKEIIASKPCLHRFPKNISKYLYFSVMKINSEYNSDPRNL